MGFCAQSALAASLTYRHGHHLFTIESARHREWKSPQEVWLYQGEEIRPPSHFRVDGDYVPPLPAGFEKRLRDGWNMEAIARTIDIAIGQELEREPGLVTIAKDLEGNITFDGLGLPGRSIDSAAASALTVRAIESGVYDIVLPVIETQPTITVLDSTLRNAGIKEVVTVGESDFGGSPLARRHNIATGLSKFDGTLIESGATFSFNEILGPVNAYTGYKEELVIHGDKTIPDYGGGLCQVSTTAYRGVWEYGFPIAARRNHSYAVTYYSPSGTDATIYPPFTDMRFVNDSPGALLIQTHQEDDHAYFIYYGTKDDRESQVLGPYVYDKRSPPPNRTEYTTEIAPGTERIVGKPVPGLKSTWYRVVRRGEEEEVETFASAYEARPLYTQIGVSNLPSEGPAWIGEVEDIEPRKESSTYRRWSIKPPRRRR